MIPYYELKQKLIKTNLFNSNPQRFGTHLYYTERNKSYFSRSWGQIDSDCLCKRKCLHEEVYFEFPLAGTNFVLHVSNEKNALWDALIEPRNVWYKREQKVKDFRTYLHGVIKDLDFSPFDWRTDSSQVYSFEEVLDLSPENVQEKILFHLDLFSKL